MSETGLPASIEAAWGIRGRPPKGPRPGLSLERIVEAGIRVAETEGLAAVSMGRVAKELGASTMALYRYVAAKNELLDLMTDTALGPPLPLTQETATESWRDGLSRWALETLDRFRHNSWALKIPIAGPPVTPNNLAWLERALHALRDTGLNPGEKMGVVMLLIGVVRAEATMHAQLAEALAAAGGTLDEAMLHYGATLRRLIDPRQFPELTTVIESGVLDVADNEYDEFEFSLARTLDGIEAYIKTLDT